MLGMNFLKGSHLHPEQFLEAFRSKIDSVIEPAARQIALKCFILRTFSATIDLHPVVPFIFNEKKRLGCRIIFSKKRRTLTKTLARKPKLILIEPDLDNQRVDFLIVQSQDSYVPYPPLALVFEGVPLQRRKSLALDELTEERVRDILLQNLAEYVGQSRP